MNQQMKLKIKRIFTENIGLKIIAFVGSVFLWLLVVNVDDPTQTKNFTVAVSVTNEDVLESQGKYYTIPRGNNTVTFKVTAKRSVMEKIADGDFVAVADMNYLEEDSRIPVSISYRGNSNNVTISAKKLYLYIEVGTNSSKSFDIQIETTGEMPEGYAISEKSVNSETVAVNGPSEVIKQINRVVAYVDTTGMTSDFEKNCSLHFLDVNGKEIDYSGLSLDKTTVKCSIKILASKKVPLTFKTSGNLPQGLAFESVTFDPASVTIMGDSSAVNGVSSIEISGSILELSKITETTTQTVDVTGYLPSNVKIATGTTSQVQMTIKVSGNMSTTINVPASNITINNIPAGYTADIVDNTISVALTGDPDTIKTLVSSGVTGTIDAGGLQEGTSSVYVNWNLGDSVVAEKVKVDIVIKPA
ncbi:MAG: hypothetical protein K6B67_09710 [Lachnospiraceae bacterium]|nr:hypothetical protein [Lachnospiraceae bacterium]